MVDHVDPDTKALQDALREVVGDEVKVTVSKVRLPTLREMSGAFAILLNEFLGTGPGALDCEGDPCPGAEAWIGRRHRIKARIVEPDELMRSGLCKVCKADMLVSTYDLLCTMADATLAEMAARSPALPLGTRCPCGHPVFLAMPDERTVEAGHPMFCLGHIVCVADEDEVPVVLGAAYAETKRVVPEDEEEVERVLSAALPLAPIQLPHPDVTVETCQAVPWILVIKADGSYEYRERDPFSRFPSRN